MNGKPTIRAREYFFMGLCALAIAASVNAQSPRDQLQQMVEQLRGNPTDNALRERIIKLAQEIKPAPGIPEEAERRMARGEAAFQNAKEPADYAKAVNEFQAAANAAPWMEAAYFNLGSAQEKAGRPAEAMAAFRLYLLTAPGAQDVAEVKKRIFKLEFAVEEKANELAKAQKAKTLIVPGKGIGEVQLGMREEEVITLWGTPSKRIQYQTYDNVEFSNGKGVSVRQADKTVSAVSTFRRDIVTSEGVGVGSRMTEVTAALGPPDDGTPNRHHDESLCYQRGISFSFYNWVVQTVGVRKPNSC